MKFLFPETMLIRPLIQLLEGSTYDFQHTHGHCFKTLKHNFLIFAKPQAQETHVKCVQKVFENFSDLNIDKFIFLLFCDETKEDNNKKIYCKASKW